ncbi:ABC transporter permease [Streptomyces sp. NPDC050560]|uniref:ABC transporter permease n=1 Tax=Streptomyces sp. NPDC050560 TaxID=3365630 RepID=UPI0037AF90E1
MLRTAVRNALAHKARLLMTVLAVLLGVAFVTGTLVFTSTVSDAYRTSATKGFERVDVAVLPRSGDDGDRDPRLTEDLRRRAGSARGAASATGVVSGFTALTDRHGDLVGGAFQSRGGNYWGAHDDRYPLAEGRAPHGGSEIALDADTARRTGYRVGDRVRMSIEGPVLTPTVTGVFTTDDGNVAAGGSLTLFDTATAQRLFHKEGAYDEIDVRAGHGVGRAALKRSLDGTLPGGTTETKTRDQLSAEQADTIASSTDSMRTGLLTFAGIALFVGVFTIINTFTMLVAQRTRELALLRAVGASRRQVTRSVLLEAALVGAVAGVAGLGIGIGVGAGLRALMNTFGSPAPDGPLVVSAGTVGIALAVGVLVTTAAAWLPARRAAKIPPVAALGAEHTPRAARSLVMRGGVGTLLAVAGAGLVALGAGRDKDAAQLPLGAGAALLILGVFVLTPLLARPLIAAAGPVLRLFGVAGRLAGRNAVRTPRRTAATASALMIGLTLITGLTVIATSAQRAVEHMASSSLRADYSVSMANFGTLAPSVTDKLAAVDGVTAAGPLRLSSGRAAGKDSLLTAVDGRHLGRLLDPPVVSGAFRAGGDGVSVDKSTAKRLGVTAGDTFTLRYEDGARQRMRVAGVYEGNEAVQGIVVDDAVLAAHQETVQNNRVLVKAAHGATPAMKDALEKALGDTPAIKVQDRQDVTDSISGVFTLMLNLLYGLLAMAVVVAVLGVVNTLAMSVFERSREIGMLRAVGLDRRAVRGMVRLESVVISLFGGVLGVGLGMFLGWAVGRVMATQVATYALVVPWARMGVFLLLAAAVGVLAALWPARRAARLPVLRAVATE